MLCLVPDLDLSVGFGPVPFPPRDAFVIRTLKTVTEHHLTQITDLYEIWSSSKLDEKNKARFNKIEPEYNKHAFFVIAAVAVNMWPTGASLRKPRRIQNALDVVLVPAKWVYFVTLSPNNSFPNQEFPFFSE